MGVRFSLVTQNWSGGGMVDAKIGEWGIVLIAPI